jgi:hypothetical protein
MKPEWWTGFHTALAAIAATLTFVLIAGIKPSPATEAKYLHWEAISAIASILAALATAAAVIVALRAGHQAELTAKNAVAFDHQMRLRRDQQALAAALSVELQTWVTSASGCGFIEWLQQHANDRAIDISQFRTKRFFQADFIVYRRAAGDIGILPKEAIHDIVLAYESAIQIAARIKSSFSLGLRAHSSLDQVDASDVVAILRATIEQAEQAISKLQEIEKPTAKATNDFGNKNSAHPGIMDAR